MFGRIDSCTNSDFTFFSQVWPQRPYYAKSECPQQGFMLYWTAKLMSTQTNLFCKESLINAVVGFEYSSNKKGDKFCQK